MEKPKTTLTIIDLKHSPWSGYKGNSLGRVLHYLYNYLGYNYAEAAIITSKDVTYWGKKIADVDHNMGYPVFTFNDNLSADMRFMASRRQDSAMDTQHDLAGLLEDFRMVLEKGLDYAVKDTTFPHNRNKMMEIQRKYFKDE